MLYKKAIKKVQDHRKKLEKVEKVIAECRAYILEDVQYPTHIKEQSMARILDIMK